MAIKNRSEEHVASIMHEGRRYNLDPKATEELKKRKASKRRTALSASDAEDLMIQAQNAIPGVQPTGIEQGGPDDLLEEDGEWSVEITFHVADIQAAPGFEDTLPYNNIQFGGWIDMRNYDGELEMTAWGGLAFDGNWQDDDSKLGGEYDILRGDWEGTGWNWYKDTM